MRKACALISVLLGVALFAGSALAQAKPAEKSKPAEKGQPAVQTAAKAEPATRHQVTGQVVSTDAAKKMLVLKAKDKEMTFTATEKAALKLADLKAGDKVVVRYTEEQGKLTAHSITKPEAKPEAAQPPKK